MVPFYAYYSESAFTLSALPVLLTYEVRKIIMIPIAKCYKSVTGAKNDELE